MREGSVAYIDVELRYYGVCSRPEQLSDSEWASAYAILESVRNREKQETIAAGRLHIPH